MLSLPHHLRDAIEDLQVHVRSVQFEMTWVVHSTDLGNPAQSIMFVLHSEHIENNSGLFIVLVKACLQCCHC